MKISRESEWFAFIVMTLGILTFLGLVLGIIFWLKPPIQNVGRSAQPIYAFDAKKTQLSMGRLQFSVAENHIREKNSKSIVMHALLPDFQGYSKQNWWLFEEKSPSSRMILIQIEEMHNMINEQTKFKFLKEKHLKEVPYPTAALGLTHYLYKSNTNRKDQDVFSGFDGNNHRLVYFCFRPTPLSLSPTCSRTFAVALDTALTYKFKRHHLSNWREIELNIKKFIRQIHLLSSRSQS